MKIRMTIPYRNRFGIILGCCFVLAFMGPLAVTLVVRAKQYGSAVICIALALILLVPKKGYASLCIEMKKPGGRVSDTQKAFCEAAKAFKNKYVVCYSVEEFKTAVREYLE